MPAKSKGAKRQNVPDKTAKVTNTPHHEVSIETQKPKWPHMEPTMSASDISVATLLEGQILTVSKLWTASLCKSYVNFLSTLPLTTTPGKPKKGEAVRVNDRFQVDDAAFAERLWSGTALKEIVEHPVLEGRELSTGERDKLWGGQVLGLNCNIRIYRYTKGQFFDQHYDDSNNVSFPSAHSQERVAAKTTWTLLLYLSSPATGCKGGETVFYQDPPSKREATPPPIVVELEVGMALLHKHGRDCLLHEGREVLEGDKWIIRSDLCVKR